jgi:hypothetical protein
MMEKDEKMIMETTGQDFFQMGSFHDYIKLPEANGIRWDTLSSKLTRPCHIGGWKITFL